MNEKQYQEKLRRIQRAQQLKSLEADHNRAKTFNVGTTGCGEVELSMRGVDGTFLWNVHHPAEVVEIIHQLSAAIGCHILIKPRNDFSSWREWRELTEEDYAHLNGWAPFAELASDALQQGKGLLPKDRKFPKAGKLTQEERADGVGTEKERKTDH